MGKAVSGAAKALEQFGKATQAAAGIIEREFAFLREFAAERAIETANDRAFRRQLRLRRDRKNWRVT